MLPMRKPEAWLLAVLVCAGLMGRWWAGKDVSTTATPTTLPTVASTAIPTAPLPTSPTAAPTALSTASPRALSTAGPVAVKPAVTATPEDPARNYDPPPAFEVPSYELPREVQANGWDGYDANELAHAAGSSTGTYYVAAASKGNFYAAFESAGRWRLFHLQRGRPWKPLGEAIVHKNPGWPGGGELDRMGAGQIPEKAWRALRSCPPLRFYPVTD